MLRGLSWCQKGLNIDVNGSDTQWQTTKARRQSGQTLEPWKLLSRPTEKRMRLRKILSKIFTFTSLLSGILFHHIAFPSSLRATVHSAKPNKGQGPTFLLRTSFTSPGKQPVRPCSKSLLIQSDCSTVRPYRHRHRPLQEPHQRASQSCWLWLVETESQREVRITRLQHGSKLARSDSQRAGEA